MPIASMTLFSSSDPHAQSPAGIVLTQYVVNDGGFEYPVVGLDERMLDLVFLNKSSGETIANATQHLSKSKKVNYIWVSSEFSFVVFSSFVHDGTSCKLSKSCHWQEDLFHVVLSKIFKFSLAWGVVVFAVSSG